MSIENPSAKPHSAQSAQEPDRLAEPADGERPPRLPFTVVGIGASAGGIEAFCEFFDAMKPDSGMCFVLIQHLPPDRDSMMAEIISKHTAMPVRQVENGIPVEPDHVYIIRPGHTMTIRDGRLHLGEPVEKPGHRRPVDDFFRSLAEEQRERAVAIVMSGMGSNGSAGAQSIKAVGGVCIAQDPETAKFPSMPRNLIDSGNADFILRTQDMPEVLIRYATHPYTTGSHSADSILRRERQSLHEVLAILRARTRHDFSGYKKPTLIRRVQRRMGLSQLTKISDYTRTLRQNPSEISALADDLMIHVTGFFRDTDAWESLRKHVVLPLVADRENDSSIRAWVTACSSGEEAYTLAMLLSEAAEEAGKHFDIKIFATDTADRSLGQARSGTYPLGIESEVSPKRIERFFDRDDSLYRVKKELRERVVFAPQNVLQDPPFSKLDICTCRNLLIYLEPELQRRVLALLHFGLREGAALFLGTSETVTGAEELFEPLDKKWRIYRRVGPTRHGLVDFPRPHSSVEFERGEARSVPRSSIAHITNKVLLENHTPPAVVIDRQNSIVFFHGNTERFLVQPRGEPTRDLMSLAIEPVRGALRTALQRAASQGETVTVRDGVIETEQGRRRIEVSVAPLDTRAAPMYFLVSFIDTPEPDPLPPAADGARPEDQRRLEEELQRARDELQSTIEELQTSNEEMKASNEEITSVNEELQSSNEELETSKEELQSLNEELSTVNSQLQSKMEELEATTNDLTSLLSSTDIAVIFLDTNFRIRRFTPAVNDLFELIPSDVGRPLSDLARKFSDPDLESHARAVLDKLIPLEKEVTSESSRVYMRRVLPYRTTDNRIQGVVITFVDVSERHRAVAACAQAEERLRLAVEAGGICEWEMEIASKRLYWSPRLRNLFRIAADVKEDNQLIQALIHPDDRATRDQALARAMDPAGDGTYRVDFRIMRPDGGVVWVESRGRVWFTQHGNARIASVIRGTIMDVTERKNAELALKHAKQAAEAANEAKDQFLANVSHELRTPLSAILLWVKLFEDEKSADRAQLGTGVTAIRRSAEALHELVEDLLDVSRISAGKVRLELQPTDLTGVIHSAVDAIRPAAKGKDVQIDAKIASAGDIVHADPNRLQQIVWNLLSNAVKFTPPGGRVSLQLSRMGDEIELVVTDSGKGIRADFLPHVFDRFGQADGAAGGSTAGLGLGLNIAKQLVELHGGTIRAASAGEGKGASFTVRLPMPRG